MRFAAPLKTGTFLKRYKRFFADIHTADGPITAHVPNSGSMKGAGNPDSPCLYSISDSPTRKIPYTLEAIQVGTGSSLTWVGVNTSHPNALVEAAFKNKLISDWHGFDRCAREVKISDESRVDVVLWKSSENPTLERPKYDDVKSDATKFHIIEVKNVSLADGKLAMFPDSETVRGQKHIKELMALMKRGHTCEFVFIIQRTDVDTFAPADHIDATYGKLLREGAEAGLILSPYIAAFSESGLELRPSKLPIKM